MSERRGIRHHFATVLTISLGAILSGVRSYTAIAEWSGKLTQGQLKRYEAPSEPTIRRVLQKADADGVDRVLGEWLVCITGRGDGLAIDGKTLRGARRPDGTQVHLLNAFLHQQGVTVA